MDISRFKKRIGNFYITITTGHSVENEKDIPEMILSDLADIYLCRFLTSFLSTISFMQKNNLLLVKYNKSIWNFGYNNLTNVCRGKVLDINTREIIAYPFDKFFNLDECEETSYSNIEEILSKASYISAMDKMDGSTIIITKTKNDLLITTNGGFENIQIDLAKKLLVEKYKESLSKMDTGYTYIFELIHPKDSKVVNYNGAKKLVLLAARNLKDYRLLKYEECKEISKKINMDIVPCFEFTNLNDFIDIAKNSKDLNREGWVFRVISDNEDIMFKLKLDEYCTLHKSILGKISPFNVYELMINGTLDDALSKSDEGTKVLITDAVYKINNILENIETSLRISLEDVKSKFDISQEEFQDAIYNRQNPKYNLRIELIKYIQKNCKNYLDFDGVTAYYRNNLSVEEFLKTIDLIKFKRLCRDKQLFKEEDLILKIN